MFILRYNKRTTRRFVSVLARYGTRPSKGYVPMKPIIASLAALASASLMVLATTPASAEQIIVAAEAPQATHVNFADLDLTTDAGVQTLDGRIRTAAHNLCDEAGVQPLDVKLRSAACFKSSYADGLDQLQRVVATQRSLARATMKSEANGK